MATDATVLKQTLSFNSLRLLERKDLKCNYKSFSDSELMKQDYLKTRSEDLLEKCKSESNLSTGCKSFVSNELDREDEMNFKVDDAEGNGTGPETSENDNDAGRAAHSTNLKDTRRMHLMSVTSILQGMFGDQSEREKPASRNQSKTSNGENQNMFSVTNSGISDVCTPNPLLEGTLVSGTTGESFLAEPRCLTLKKYNPNIDPFLTDDSLIFEPDFEDEIETLEGKQLLQLKKTKNLDDITKDIFFDDEILLCKKSSATDREEGELTPEQHSAAAGVEDIQRPDTNAQLNADFFNKINECLRDINRKCRELHSSPVPKYSIKNLQRILSNVDNIKRKLSFLINSKKSDNEQKNKSNSISEKYSRNRSNESHEPTSKSDDAPHSKSSIDAKENENIKSHNQSVLEGKGTTYVSKLDENSQRFRYDSKDRRSRRRSSRDRPSQSELLNRKKTSILEKLGTRQEIERIQSLFKRQMSLIAQHVVQRKEAMPSSGRGKSDPGVSRGRHSFSRQIDSKKSREKVDLNELKTLEDMEAFLDSLKSKTSDRVQRYIDEDKMKGALKFTSKKAKDSEKTKSSYGKSTKLMPLQSSETDALRPSLKENDNTCIENEKNAKTTQLDTVGEKDCEVTGYIAKTHTLWEDDEEIENAKSNPLYEIMNPKTLSKIKIKNSESGSKANLNESNSIRKFSGEKNQNDCEEDISRYKNSKTATSGKTESDSTVRKEEILPQSNHSYFLRSSEEREKETSRKRRKKRENYFESESITEEQVSNKKRKKNDNDSESKELVEQEKQHLHEKEQKYYSESPSLIELERYHSNKHKKRNHSSSETLIEQDKRSSRRNQQKKKKNSDSESIMEEEKSCSKRIRKVDSHSESEVMTDKERQNRKKEKKDRHPQSESPREQGKRFSKRSSKKNIECSDREMSVEEMKDTRKFQKSSKPTSEEMKAGNEEQQRESKTRHASSEDLTIDPNESLMRDLLSKKIYILGDENLASLDRQFRIKVVGNEIYLKKVNIEGKRKRKSHSRRESKLKPLESEIFERNNGGYCEEEPMDPEKVNATLEEMENFLEELRSKKKVSDDDQQTLDITTRQSREEKFLARIQAKRKAKLMACVSAAPYSIEKEAKVLKALEKRELSESSDVESHKQKLIEKLRAETDAIVLAQKSGGNHSTANADDDPLMDVKALLNMIKEAESTNEENAKQVYVSFQLKKSDMKKLENLTDKPSHISEESQKLLNNVRAKMRAKKAPPSNLSSLMLKPEE